MNRLGKNKGLAFTTFAVLAASLIVMMVSVQVNQSDDVRTANADRIGEAAFFLQSTFTDMDRSLSISTRRAITAATNHVIENGEPLSKPKANVSEALVNGTLNGEELNGSRDASLSEWSSRVSKIAGRSGYDLEIEVENYSFSNEEFVIESSFAVFARLKDPSTLAQFNKTSSATSSVSIEGVEDTMILLKSKGRYVSQYSQCDFTDPADILYTGSQNSSGHYHGYAAKKPSDISAVSNKSDKVLVVDDVDSYADAEVNDFGGVVSDDTSSDSDSYTNNYVLGTSSISDIEQNMSLILNNDQVWRSGFREMFNEGCYVPDEDGPDFFDRLEAQTSNDKGTGLATLIDITELPSELQEVDSSVGYVYFNESGDFGSLREIKGVNDEYSWFRIDQDHVNYWDLEDLAE